MKRLLKILAIFALVVVLLVGGVFVLIQTDFFKNKARNIAVAKINEMLNANLSVGAITGDFLDEIQLHDVRLIQQEDTVVYISLLSIDYFLPALLRDRIQIDHLIADSVLALVKQYDDSTWNVAGLMKADSIAADTTADETPFGYTIALDKFEINRGQIVLQGLDSNLQQTLSDFYLSLKGEYEEDVQRLEFSQLRFSAQKPEMTVDSLSMELTRDLDSITVENFVLISGQNRIDMAGTFKQNDSLGVNEATLSLRTAPLDLSAFQAYVPPSAIKMNPTVTIDGRIADDTAFVTSTLQIEDQTAAFEAIATPLSALAGATAMNDIQYTLHGSINNLDAARWTGDTTFAFEGNGEFDIVGKGIVPESLTATLTADLSDCIVQGRRLQQARLDIDYDGGDASGSFRLNGPFGEVYVDAFTYNVLTRQDYTVSFTTQSLNVGMLMDREDMASDLNIAAKASGSSFDPDEMHGQAVVQMGRSSFGEYVLDTGFVQIDYAPDRYTIDTAFFHSPYGAAEAGGELSSAADARLNYLIVVDDLKRLSPFIQADSLAGNLIVEGTAQGSLDSLTTQGTVAADNVLFNTIVLDSASGQFNLAMADTNLTGQADLDLRSLQFGTYVLDTSSIAVTIRNNSLYDFTANFSLSDSLNGMIATSIQIGDVPIITVTNANLQLQSQSWVLSNPAATIRIEDNAYVISDLALNSSSGNGQISLDGTISLVGSEDFRLAVTALDIGWLMSLMPNMQTELSGELSTELALSGTAGQPIVDGYFLINKGKANEWEFDSLSLNLDYANQNMDMRGILAVTGDASVQLEGRVPVAVTLADSITGTLLRNQPVQVVVTVDSVPFQIIQAASPEIVVNDEGYIFGQVNLAGTLNSPDMSGKINIENAGFEFEKLGAKYSGIDMALSFNHDAIQLDSLTLSHDKGFLTALGTVQFANGITEGEISSADFRMHAERFWLIRTDNLEMNLDGDFRLSGPVTNPEFYGHIIINRSKLNVPLLTDEALQNSEPITKPPLLVTALPKAEVAMDSLGASVDSLAEADTISTEYYRNMRGSMTLTIPRNTWLVGPDMNVEISGEIEMVKNSPEFLELFGPISIVRGTYALFGREFVIEEGTITFSGGETVKPNVDLTAVYSFRDSERQSRDLEVHATGEAFNPNLSFSLDGDEIQQRDAVAYVVFGKSMDEVTGPGANGGESFNASNLAKSAAASALASELTEVLGDQFALDVLEIDPTQGFSGASVTVGEYVTNKLFLSYQRGIGRATDDELNPTIVTLEYEILKWLALQLTEGDDKTSGADLIFNFKIR